MKIIVALLWVCSLTLNEGNFNKRLSRTRFFSPNDTRQALPLNRLSCNDSAISFFLSRIIFGSLFSFFKKRRSIHVFIVLIDTENSVENLNFLLI